MDRLASFAHGAICVVLGAAAIVAWLAIASLFFAGASIVLIVAALREYALPVTMCAIIGVLILALWFT